MYEWLGICEVSLSCRMMVQYMIVMLQVGSLQVKDIVQVNVSCNHWLSRSGHASLVARTCWAIET